MSLNQGSAAPAASSKRTTFAAVLGRWVVILLFAGTVAGNVWQYKENMRLQADLDNADQHLSKRAALLNQQIEINKQLMAKVSEITTAAAGLVEAYEKRDATQRQAAIEDEKVQRIIAERVAAANAAKSTPAPAAPVRKQVAATPYVPPPQPELPIAAIHRALKTKIDHFYKAKRNTGSGRTLVFEVDVDYGEPREIVGWGGRYEVKGDVMFQYYDSVWGGSFSRGTGKFTAELQVSGGGARVLDFKAY